MLRNFKNKILTKNQIAKTAITDLNSDVIPLITRYLNFKEYANLQASCKFFHTNLKKSVYEQFCETNGPIKHFLIDSNFILYVRENGHIAIAHDSYNALEIKRFDLISHKNISDLTNSKSKLAQVVKKDYSIYFLLEDYSVYCFSIKYQTFVKSEYDDIKKIVVTPGTEFWIHTDGSVSEIADNKRCTTFSINNDSLKNISSIVSTYGRSLFLTNEGTILYRESYHAKPNLLDKKNVYQIAMIPAINRDTFFLLCESGDFYEWPSDNSEFKKISIPPIKQIWSNEHFIIALDHNNQLWHKRTKFGSMVRKSNTAYSSIDVDYFHQIGEIKGLKQIICCGHDTALLHIDDKNILIQGSSPPWLCNSSTNNSALLNISNLFEISDRKFLRSEIKKNMNPNYSKQIKPR